ncbi:inter-alpha-trypsin inhibitor heavy chain H3-like isoform X2 [Pomacea canaliculata]|uniref:inter-alpha-trypsin inhibitor heavy chain H3-like isoform X2 n=1 Tax=Pomacea canaliculata TaxID=400727 RepID=UPI000D727140|nr:inter-alpha-trypsin inhibitor heavy chain H3-like isoform X2 [Pomacea canaliculata]
MAPFARWVCALLVLLCQYQPTSSQTVHKLAIRSDVRFRFATTEVECVMSNDKSSPHELMFDFTLPKGAFITNFSMTIEGKEYPGQVKEKGQAREQYLTALTKGHTGGLVEESTRHTNTFDVSINIQAGGNVTFTLLYQELLRRRFGSYEHLVHVNPNTGAKDFSIEVYVQELTEIKDVKTPPLRKDILSNAVSEGQNALTKISQPTPTAAHVVFHPTQSELKNTGSGWFVVQYDVASANTGELLVVDGYFVHFFVPPSDLAPLPLDIVFVLDRSGSMIGRPIVQLRNAMTNILRDVREIDRLNIIIFNDEVENWQDGLVEATKTNINKAVQYVNNIWAVGWTNIHAAFMRGLRLLKEARAENRVPVLFFLTDGRATAGWTSSNQIINDVTSNNDGVANVYCLAFGSSADYELMKQVSAKNNGFARKVYPAADAALQVTGLYTEISTVILRDMTITYYDSGNTDNSLVRIDNSSLTTCVFPTMFGQADAVVAGRIDNPTAIDLSQAMGLTLTVSGQGATGQVNLVLDESLVTQLTLNTIGENRFWSVPRDLADMTERSWAYLTIKQLLQQKEAFKTNETLVKELDTKILELSLQYHFVTPLTSMVVTRPEDADKKADDNAPSAASFADTDERNADSPGLMRTSSVRQHYQYMGPPHRPRYASMLPLMGYFGPVFPDQNHMDVGRRGMPNKDRRGPKSQKKLCKSNSRVILQAALLSDSSSDPKICFELHPKADINYTLFEYTTENFRIVTGQKDKQMSFLAIYRGAENVNISVNDDGNLDVLHDPSGSSTLFNDLSKAPNTLDLQVGAFHVSVLVAKTKCSTTFLAVKVRTTSNLAHARRLHGGVLGDAMVGNDQKSKKNGKVAQQCAQLFKTTNHNSRRLGDRELTKRYRI